MYKILINYYSHFYFITTFEIIFYSYFIFPYEQAFVGNLLTTTLANIEDRLNKEISELDISSLPPYIIDKLPVAKDFCENKDNDVSTVDQVSMVNVKNQQLFFICYIYIGIASFILFILFAVDLHYRIKKYRIVLQHENERRQDEAMMIIDIEIGINPTFINPAFINGNLYRDNHSNGIMEMTEFNPYNNNNNNNHNNREFGKGVNQSHIISTNTSSSQSQSQSQSQSNTNVYNNVSRICDGIMKKTHVSCSFMRYYYIKSVFIQEVAKTIKFMLMICLFEYLYFSYIVSKLTVYDFGDVLCDVVKSLRW